MQSLSFRIHIRVHCGHCVLLNVLCYFMLGKRQRTYTVTKTSVTTHQRTRHVQPSYENVLSSRCKAYENFLSPNHTGSEPPYNNVFPMQESCSTLTPQPVATLLPQYQNINSRQYQNVNPRTSQLKANNSESPISSSIGRYPSSSSTPGHSISTCATESTGISSLAVHASFNTEDGIFDNAEDFASTAPSCSSSQQSNPSYTNVFTVTSSLDELSNVSIGSSLSSEEPPPLLPPHTDEMLQATEAAEEPNTGGVNSSAAGHRLVADGDETVDESTKPNTALNAEGSSEIDGQSSVVSRPQTPGTPPLVPEHTLRMYCQRLDPNDPTAQPDPDWVMRPPPLIPKYSKLMHQLTDTPDAVEEDTARNQTPQTVSKPVPVPPPIEEEILLAVMQFKRLQREGKLEFEPVTEEDSTTSRDDKMTLGEFLGHNYEDVGPGHPRQRSYLQYRSDLRPSSSHAPYEPTDNDPYHFVYNLAYVLKRRSN